MSGSGNRPSIDELAFAAFGLSLAAILLALLLAAVDCAFGGIEERTYHGRGFVVEVGYFTGAVYSFEEVKGE